MAIEIDTQPIDPGGYPVQLIDFERPFIIGVFWGMVFLLLLVLLIVSVLIMRRLLLAYIQTHNQQLLNTASIASLEERIKSRDELEQAHDDVEKAYLASVTRESDLEVGSVRKEWLNTRQRWTLTANQLITAQSWITLLIDALRKNNIMVPIPPNVETLDRRPDESVYFNEIERAAEHRLDDILTESRRINEELQRTSLKQHEEPSA